jgi:phosphonate transport system ATP-binding protein
MVTAGRQDAAMSKDFPAIEVRHASKTFAGQRQALKNVQLSIEPGEIVALLGASGSGKSTLLRCLCGLEVLDRPGEVRLQGQLLQAQGRLSSQVRGLRRHTGIIFQQFNLVGRMSLLSNVLTGLLPHVPLWRSLLGRFSDAERMVAMRALDAVGLADHALQRASTLSGGQQQRAAIARALVQGAQILLADEHVASLDPESTRRVMDILRKLCQQQGMTLVVSLHNVALARQYCSRIVALREGELVYDGRPDGLDARRLAELYGPRCLELIGSEEAAMPLEFAPAA